MLLRNIFDSIDLSKTKLIRHNISNKIVSQNYTKGYIEIYQSIQTRNRFKDCEYIMSFLGEEGTSGTFLGCYKIEGYIEIADDTIPSDFYMEDGFLKGDCVFWSLVKTDIMEELQNRLVIDWGKGAINWCQNGTTDKEILYILPKVSEFEFVSYDKTILTYDHLKAIISNPKEHKIWQDKLSAVAGIYLITDTKTGKLYVGSASGENGGIWGRWSEYAKTKHGGNKRLIELIKADKNYCENFQYSILEVFPIKRDRHEILQYEQLYKKKMCSVQFGYNDN